MVHEIAAVNHKTEKNRSSRPFSGRGICARIAAVTSRPRFRSEFSRNAIKQRDEAQQFSPPSCTCAARVQAAAHRGRRGRSREEKGARKKNQLTGEGGEGEEEDENASSPAVDSPTSIDRSSFESVCIARSEYV